jgi:porin
MQVTTKRIAAAGLVLMLPPAADLLAYDMNDRLTVSGIVAAAGQCQQGSARLATGQFDTGGQPLYTDFDDTCRGALPIQLEASLRPTEQDELFVKLGWAWDNGLNPVSPFRLTPWAAALQDNVHDINGRGRNYLLTAWYKHAFSLGNDDSIAVSLGIIDSTDYLDGNAYANDEYTQFMNEAFVNASNYLLPSYDTGAAAEAHFGAFSVTAVGMNVGENDAGENYDFWGLQAGWHPEPAIGAGNYRVLVAGTSAAFPDPSDRKLERRLAYGLSFDQAIGDHLGAFLRLTWQTEDAAVDYATLYSGGLQVLGSAWGRDADTVGVGVAYLDGGNTDVRNSQVLETYYRAQFGDLFALTADVQYMHDDLVQTAAHERDPDGWIFGLRATVEF